MRIAFVYDRINKFGGAERILAALHQLWPQAPFYTAVYHPETAVWAKGLTVIDSWLKFFPLAKTHHELYPWLTPLAFESFEFDKFDVVVSVTSAEAKAIITKPKTLHLCYCLTPTRYLWSHQKTYLDSPGLGVFSWLGQKVFSATRSYLQQLDRTLASRPDLYLAISQTVQKRIKKYYHRDSVVIYPPVDTKKFSQPVFNPNYGLRFTNYFLLVSRLTPYKKVDLAIKAFNHLGQNLVTVGQGRELVKLKKLSGPTIKFLPQVSESNLIWLYQHSQALIMPQEEDFGLAAVEAQAAGCPVIAFQKGGATETVVNGKSGVFFKEQTVDSLVKAVKQFKPHRFQPAVVKDQAAKFDVKIFNQKISQFVEAQWQNRKNSL